MLRMTRGGTQIRTTTRGFTLVELLVVIVVIGILAAIAIPVFLSQADKASDASLKSDLANAAKLLQVAEANGETLPSEITAGQSVDLGSAGTFTSTQTITVTGSGESLCVEGVSDSGNTFSADLSEGIRNYDCDGNANGIEPLVMTYSGTSFTRGSDGETLTVSVSGGDGSDVSFAIAGSLPDGVLFDQATGEFSGPSASEWHFQATQIAAGSTHTCALTDTSAVYCWGGNNYGQLGDGTTTDSNTPVRVVGSGGSGYLGNVTQLSSNFEHTCATTSSESVYCWGRNNYGQLGYDGEYSTTPNPVQGLAGTGTLTNISHVQTGWNHTCAITSTQTLYCWGDNYWGQVGDNTRTQTNTPTQVTGTDGTGALSNIESLSAGANHVCATTAPTGSVYCWGRNTYGQLGQGTTSTMYIRPIQVKGPEGVGSLTGIASLTSSYHHTCGTTDTNGIYCWGHNSSGQLGDGSTTDRPTPIAVQPASGNGELTNVVQVTAGTLFTCATTSSGNAYCWGRNTYGQLGDTTTTNSAIPVQVLNISTITTLNAGRRHVCAATSPSDTLYCWGRNTNGQLGDDTTTHRDTPTNTLTTPAGFPATVTITVTDDTVTTDQPITLTVD